MESFIVIYFFRFFSGGNQSMKNFLKWKPNKCAESDIKGLSHVYGANYILLEDLYLWEKCAFQTRRKRFFCIWLLRDANWNYDLIATFSHLWSHSNVLFWCVKLNADTLYLFGKLHHTGAGQKLKFHFSMSQTDEFL